MSYGIGIRDPVKGEREIVLNADGPRLRLARSGWRRDDADSKASVGFALHEDAAAKKAVRFLN